MAQRFVRNHRRRYPVLQDGVLVGQISRRDVLQAAMQFFLVGITDGNFLLDRAQSNTRHARAWRDDLIDLLEIGLALSGFHDLAHKESQHLIFAAAQLIKLFWVGCNQVVDDLRQSNIVAHLSQVQRFNEFVDVGVRVIAHSASKGFSQSLTTTCRLQFLQ